ncbi:MAG: hypothetical protein HY954_12380 [Deltaproteobacteria bacterium]|nr:hypothetical protein [Deltaproteobacteria bacterium]
MFISAIPSFADLKTVNADLGSKTGRISNFISGVSDGPAYDAKSYLPLKEAKFKLVEVMIWLSNPEQGRFPARNDARELERNIQTAKKQIRSIIDIGAEPLVFMVSSRRPDDLTRYQEQVKGIVGELRSSVRESGRDLLIFRFGNEPESRHFWQGTRQEFFDTYRAWATAVKSVSSAYLVEAPGFISATNKRFLDNYYDSVNEFSIEFLEFCKRNRVPLDIFTFHFYGTDLSNLAKEVAVVKKELEKYPGLSPAFGVPKVGVDEWNIYVFGLQVGKYVDVFDTAETAAHNVAAMIDMARNGAWLGVRFGATNVAPPNKPDGMDGMPPGGDRPPPPGGPPGGFGGPGPGPQMGGGAPKGAGDFLMVKLDRTPKPSYYAFSAFNELLSTPELFAINAEKGIRAIAGKSPDGRQINIVLSFYDEAMAEAALKKSLGEYSFFPNKTLSSDVRLKLKNIAKTDIVEIKRFVVNDRSTTASPVEARTVSQKDGEISLEFRAETPSVMLIQLRLR